MVKKVLLASIGVFTLPVFAFAQSFDLPPSDILDLLPEKDWADLYCKEAKSQSSQGISKLEALSELLPSLLSQTENIKISDFDFDSMISSIRSATEKVCGQTTARAAYDAAKELALYGSSLEKELAPKLRAEIEPQLKKQGDELKNTLTSQIKPEADKLKQEAEDKLRSNAAKEAKDIEDALKAGAADEEAGLADLVKAELTAEAEAEIQARAQVGEFGEKPDQAQLFALGQQLVNQRISAAAEKASADLKEKYKTLAADEEKQLNDKYALLAEQEETRIKASLEELKSAEFKEKKEAFENLAQKFENLPAAVQNRFEQKKSAWLPLQNKAIAKKKEILTAVMSSQVNNRIEVVSRYADAIDRARLRGVNIPSVQELIAQLRTNLSEMINDLAQKELNSSAIMQAATELGLKCEAVRFVLEQAEPSADSREIYQSIQKKLEEFGYDKAMISAINKKWLTGARKHLGYYQNWQKACQISQIQTQCEFVYNQNFMQKFGGKLQEAASAEEKLASVLKEFLNYDENSGADVLSDYKSRLVDALTQYKIMSSATASMYPQRQLFIIKDIMVILPYRNNGSEIQQKLLEIINIVGGGFPMGS